MDTPRTFEVAAAPQSVEFWSHRRLPNEPTGPMYDGREALRRAITDLVAAPGSILAGEYSSTQVKFFDLENILFYNVGPGTFKHLSNVGLRARRRYAAPPRAPSGTAFDHYHRYELIERSPSPGAEPPFTFSVADLGRKPKAADYWWAASVATVGPVAPLAGHYGLHVEVPAGRANLADLMKPLLDGIICAMHPTFNPDDEAIDRLAATAQWPRSDIVQRLQNPRYPALPARTVLRCYREPPSIKWDPGDDLCDEFSVISVAGHHCRVWPYSLPGLAGSG